MKSKKVFLLFPAALCFVYASCLSIKVQEERLAPRRSTSEIRLDDIRGQIAANPVKAIDLIGIYREIYGDLEEQAELAGMEEQAVESLKTLQAKAVAEERWDDAASLSRSLSVLGVTVEKNGMEPDFLLEYAKKNLAEGKDLAAFLAAVQSHESSPLSFDDALLFLERAVKLQQRRTAAYFCAIAESAAKGKIPADLREYAQGRDSVSAMLRGVATVLIDRGIKNRAGQGLRRPRARFRIFC